MAEKKPRVIPFEELDAYFRDPTSQVTDQEFINSVRAERTRRLQAAKSDEYVAVPVIFRGGMYMEYAQTWSIEGPEVPEFTDGCGHKQKRRPITLGITGEGFGRAGMTEFVQPYADDLAAALTLGHRARLHGGV